MLGRHVDSCHGVSNNALISRKRQCLLQATGRLHDFWAGGGARARGDGSRRTRTLVGEFVVVRPVRAGPSVGNGKTRDGKRKEAETRCLFVGLFGAHQIRSVDGGFFRFDP